MAGLSSQDGLSSRDIKSMKAAILKLLVRAQPLVRIRTLQNSDRVDGKIINFVPYTIHMSFNKKK